jgi:hypothetical protein
MNEVVPINMRGGLVNLHSTFYIIGYAIAAWAGFGFSFWTKGGLSTWRPAIAMQAGLSLMELCALYWIPESPRWLVMQDRMNEAKTLLDRLHSDPSDPENEYARAEFYQIQKQLYIDRTLGNTWWHILKKKSYRKRALLAIATGFLWQSSGDLVINSKIQKRSITDFNF